MTDDFTTDNSVNFNGSFKTSNSVLKVNSLVATGFGKADNKGFKYDASLETKVFGLDAKFTLKSPNLITLLDFGSYRWTKVIAGKPTNMWFNPYFKLKMD
jgi:hypothetical protein